MTSHDDHDGQGKTRSQESADSVTMLGTLFIIAGLVVLAAIVWWAL